LDPNALADDHHPFPKTPLVSAAMIVLAIVSAFLVRLA
jgi:hypothetical protein